MGEQWAVAPVVDGRAVWETARTVCAVCGARNQPTLAARVATLQSRLDGLLVDLEHARAERDTAEARAAAAMQMANAANAKLRQMLLKALGREDDGRTPLMDYVFDLVVERDEARAELAEVRDALDQSKTAHRVAVDETQRLRTQVDRLRTQLERARGSARAGEVRRLRQQLARQRQVVADGLRWLLDLPVIRRGHVEQLRRMLLGGES